jgi:heptosyltransferase-2
MTRDSPSRPGRILAIKLADVGDLLLITPALRAIRHAYPAAKLDVLATPRGAGALRNLSLIDELLLFDKYPFDHLLQSLHPAGWGNLIGFGRQLRARRYDTVLLFHHLSLGFGVLKHGALMLATGAPRRIGLDNGRGWFLTHRIPDPGFGVRPELEIWLDLAAAAGASVDAGAPPHHDRPEIEMTDADTDRADELLFPGMGGPADRPIVALHPGSGGYSLARRWGLDKFAQLGRRLGPEGLGARIVIVGTLADGTDELAAGLGECSVNLGGRTTVPQLAAVLARCDLLIGADSGVLHVASAVGTPTVALFGPTNHRAWAPALPPAKLAVVRAGSACSPCAYTHLGLGTPSGCPERTCMAMISVEQVVAASQSILAGKTPADEAPEPPDSGSVDGLPTTVSILGVPLHPMTFEGLLDWIDRMVGAGHAHQIATVNPEFIMTARRDPVFRLVLERTTLCLADGVGLLWAARWLSRAGRGAEPAIPERVTGSDGVPLIAERAAEKGWRVFLLGAAPGVAQRAARVLAARYPGLQIVGTCDGDPTAEEEEEIVQLVNQSKADILFVAYGAPTQDKWIARNLPRLRVGVAMGVGGAFDFICGKTARAPRWMRRVGLEWLYRLFQEPWRWRRMLALPHFAFTVLLAGLRKPPRTRKPQ